ncbi:hypothetical protein ABZ027_09815 [Streptomyces sp. NPDC006332]|uniref:hypothetical protein n=1 Tax=Streptomyces sp. NPDC006332 TaxID=3155456 RepID=UPI0033BF1475
MLTATRPPTRAASSGVAVRTCRPSWATVSARAWEPRGLGSTTSTPTAIASRARFVTNDGLLRPELTAEDLVLFSGSLSQAALATGDSHPGQGCGLLRISRPLQEEETDLLR